MVLCFIHLFWILCRIAITICTIGERGIFLVCRRVIFGRCSGTVIPLHEGVDAGSPPPPSVQILSPGRPLSGVVSFPLTDQLTPLLLSPSHGDGRRICMYVCHLVIVQVADLIGGNPVSPYRCWRGLVLPHDGWEWRQSVSRTCITTPNVYDVNVYDNERYEYYDMTVTLLPEIEYSSGLQDCTAGSSLK